MKGMINNKKAVSEVLATLLIVLFVIAALIIVSVVLFQFIRKQSEEITAGCVTIDIPITKAEFNATSNITRIYVKMAAGDADMIGMKFIFDGKEKAPSEESDDTALKLLETGKYIFSNITSKPKKIELAPIIKTEAEKEMNCGIKASIREKDIVEKAISVSAPQSPSSPQFQDIRTGLVAEWKFDENPQTHLGTAPDSSGNGNSGNVYTNDGTANKAVNGKVNSALQLDGVDDVVLVDDAPSLNPVSNITIEAWFNMTNYPDGTSMYAEYQSAIVAKGGTPSIYPDYEFFILGDAGPAKLCYFLSGPGNCVDGYITTNQWYHAALTYDHSNVRLYLNGIQIGSFPQTGDLSDSTYKFGIGNRNPDDDGRDRYFNGIIDEVRIWNRSLSAAEIQQFYQFYQ